MGVALDIYLSDFLTLSVLLLSVKSLCLTLEVVALNLLLPLRLVTVTPAKECEGASNNSGLNRDGKARRSAMAAIASVSYINFKLDILEAFQTKENGYLGGPGTWHA